jgi:polysaccharide export outer membrane protein
MFGLAGLAWAGSSSSEKADDRGGKAGVASSAEQGTLKAEETLIYPNDLLAIQVFDVEQMTHDYRVSATGTLTLPLLAEPIRAAGLTPQQLAELVSEKFKESGVLSHARVTITIRESRIHAVAVAGAVKKPQIYPVFGRTTLLDVLSEAEGVSEEAGASVIVTRGEVAQRILEAESAGAVDGGESQVIPTTVTVDLTRLLDAGDTTANIDVFPGDRVTVQRAGTFYVVGAVMRGGGFLLTRSRQDITVLRAIALAENLTPTAKRKKAIVIRQNSSAPGGREQIPINLEAMLKGRAPDMPLQDSDILYVPDSTSAKMIRKGAEAAVQVTTGVLIFR